MRIGQLVGKIARKIAVAFAGSFFLPYSIMLVLLLIRGDSAPTTGLEHWFEVGFLMMIAAIGSYAIETMWDRKSIRIPFSYVGAHALFFGIVLLVYMQDWMFLIAGFVMGMIIAGLDRLFTYWVKMMFQIEGK